jgi:hypothetical protein
MRVKFSVPNYSTLFSTAMGRAALRLGTSHHGGLGTGDWGLP